MDKFTEYFLVWVIAGTAGTVNALTGFDRFFGTRRQRYPAFIAYFTAKSIATSWYASALVYNPPSIAFRTGWTVLITVLAITSFVVLWYTWRDDPLKIAVTGVLNDAISGTTLLTATALIYLARGRKVVDNLLQLSLADAVLVAAVSILLYRLVLKALGPLIRRFGSYEFRHRRLVAAVIIFLIAALSTSHLDSRIDLEHGLFASYITMAIIVFFGANLIYRKLRTQVKRKAILKKRSEMTEAYLMALDAQSESVQEQRELLEYIKGRIESTSGQAGGTDLSGYVEDLKEQLKALQYGNYTGSITVDAVLTVFAERLKDLGAETDFRIAGIGDFEDKVAGISMILLGRAEAECRRLHGMHGDESGGQEPVVSYGISRHKNQLRFELVIPGETGLRTLRNNLREYMSKSDILTGKRTEGGFEISLMTEVSG